MEWYDQILKENQTLADYNDIALNHVEQWKGYATSDFSALPETSYIISFVVTALVGLFLLWVLWRLISWPFRKKSSSSSSSSSLKDITLVKPDGYESWPRAMQVTYLQAEFFLIAQAQHGEAEAEAALQALNNKDHSLAIHFIGTVRDKAQMSGDQKQQLEMVNFTSALQFVDNKAAAKQTIEHGLSINNQDPMTLLLNGDIALAQKNIKESFASYNQSLQYAKEQKHAKAEILSLQMLGDIALRQKNFPQAEAYLTDSITLSNVMIKKKKDNKSWKKMAIRSHSKLAKVQLLQQKFEDSNQSYNQALTLQERLVASDPKNVNLQREIPLIHGQMGDAFAIQKDIKQSYQSFGKAATLSKALHEKNPKVLIIQRDYALALNKLGKSALLANDKNAALQNFTNSLALREQIAKENPSAPFLRDLEIGHERLGDYYHGEKDLKAAGKHFNQAYLLAKKILEKAPNNLLHQEDLTRYLSRLSLIQAKSGQAAESLKTMAHVIQIKENTVKKLPQHNGVKTSLVKSYLAMATLNITEKKVWFTKAHTLLSPLSKTFTAEQKQLMAVLEKQLQPAPANTIVASTA